MNIKISKERLISLSFIICSLLFSGAFTSCSEYLEIYPENALPTEKYWTSKADVEASLSTGYLYLRQSVIEYLIPWGELRSGCLEITGSSYSGSSFQQFQIKPTTKISGTAIVNWAPMYKIVNTANLVLKNASKALGNDETYTESEMKSHLCEAYWLRALAYFYIVRNWRDAPLLLDPFETDEASYNVAKASEAELIAQIKADLQEAIKLDAAKEVFNTTWETKGRATKWAIYALLTDVCLWNQNFDEAVTYADAILASTSANKPVFLSAPSRNTWFTIFNPGNSSESIYEVQWSHEASNGVSAYQTNDLPRYFKQGDDNVRFVFSKGMQREFANDYNEFVTTYGDNQDEQTLDKAVRTRNGSFCFSSSLPDITSWASEAYDYYVWKYVGGTTRSVARTTTNYDPNFIIYRMADIMLMKAEALVMRNMGHTPEDNAAAIELTNQIRRRTNLSDLTLTATSDAATILESILRERIMELSAEGKSWYDMLRMGRYKDPSGQINFKERFLIDNVKKYNNKTNESWIAAVLSNENAWYLPVADSEMKTNSLLEQNPYYQ